jgi:hypothetical protein
MRPLLFISLILLSFAASAQHHPWADSLIHHQHRFVGHHGRDSIRHAAIERAFDANPGQVKTFTTTSVDSSFIDTLRTDISDHNGVFHLFIEGTAPNGHTVTDTKTIVVGNPDGHNTLLHRHEGFARQWGEEQAQGSFWNVGYPKGSTLICVWVKGLKNRNFVWRYLKLKE